MIANAVAVVIPSALWIASINVQGPNRLILIWLAIPLGQSRHLNTGYYATFASAANLE